MKRFLAILFLSFVVWALLIPEISPDYLIIGLIASGAIAWALSKYALEGMDRRVLDPRRWLYFLAYLWVLVKGVFMAGLLLIPIILKRNEIRPGVVAIPTSLKKGWELTLLANSITLTPGTFFLDLDEEKGMLYVHWISIRSESAEEIRKLITERYEKILSKVFE
jgi:multicomponent Na+:H+ antiporter subunit E